MKTEYTVTDQAGHILYRGNDAGEAINAQVMFGKTDLTQVPATVPTPRKKTTKKREVFLAWTQMPKTSYAPGPLGSGPVLLKIYSKSSYQAAYNWLADIAERHGNDFHPTGAKLPVPGTGINVAMTRNGGNGQTWWLERHEVE